MTTQTAPSPADLIARYSTDLAYVSESAAATTLADLAHQASTAAYNLGQFGGINGAEDIADAAVYLGDAANATGTDLAALLRQAEKKLHDLDDLVQEYREMVGD